VMRTFMNGNGVSATRTESSQIFWMPSRGVVVEYLNENFGCVADECYFPEGSFYLG
jgi:hypothetical protein